MTHENPSDSTREEWSDSTAMGTTVHVCVVGGAGAPVAAVAHAAIAEVDAALSRFRPSSDVSRLNASPGLWVPAGEHLVAVAEAAQRYRELTRGAFDTTLPAAPAVTSHAGIGVGADPRLRWRPIDGGWEARLEPGHRLDFGAVAKGYAADLARDRSRARASGVLASGLLVSVGTSSIALAGRPARRDTWRIALGSPWAAVAETLGYVEAAEGSFSMSGVRGARLGSTRLTAGHVLDPRTGRPADTDLGAVGVLAADGMRGEALSTAALVLGLDEAVALCRAHEVEAVFLTVDGRILATASLAPRLRLRAGVQETLRRWR